MLCISTKWTQHSNHNSNSKISNSIAYLIYWRRCFQCTFNAIWLKKSSIFKNLIKNWMWNFIETNQIYLIRCRYDFEIPSSNLSSSHRKREHNHMKFKLVVCCKHNPIYPQITNQLTSASLWISAKKACSFRRTKTHNDDSHHENIVIQSVTHPNNRWTSLKLWAANNIIM